MANGWSLLVGLIVIIVASLAAWFLSPKGENQTVTRNTLILTFIACYLMWGTLSSSDPIAIALLPGDPVESLESIVFLAQLHPLIVPKRADIRPDRVPR
ncbi:hypothetical protein N7495_000349 [Penicillium taxi]|uniref:uncharacterized protein n=1 Tax=Penicillium taxi TaxID=168475 RepID=UPI002545A8BB|nr:uncharacterized protein N7495_000349 [Penicillium taxi]KAJ5907667.1 hypothetical protein N7495_000349 [Penicillium taxi]